MDNMRNPSEIVNMSDLNQAKVSGLETPRIAPRQTCSKEASYQAAIDTGNWLMSAASRRVE